MSSRLLDTVFDIQIRYAIKLADVVRHKNHILRSGVRGIQHIQWFKSVFHCAEDRHESHRTRKLRPYQREECSAELGCI